jgi:hypothetical protein
MPNTKGNDQNPSNGYGSFEKYLRDRLRNEVQIFVRVRREMITIKFPCKKN